VIFEIAKINYNETLMVGKRDNFDRAPEMADLRLPPSGSGRKPTEVKISLKYTLSLVFWSCRSGRVPLFTVGSTVGLWGIFRVCWPILYRHIVSVSCVSLLGGVVLFT